MKTNIKINAVTREITMTKATAKRASFAGSKECEQLAQTMKNFPTFTVKVLNQKSRESKHKGLSVDLMENLIKVMTDNSEEALEELRKEKAKYKGTKGHYSNLKEYFLAEYPNWREYLYAVEKRQAEEQAQKGEKQKDEMSQMAEQQEQIHAEPVTAVEEQTQEVLVWQKKPGSSTIVSVSNPELAF